MEISKMKTTNKTLFLLGLLTPIVLLSGCSSEQTSMDTMAGTDALEFPQSDVVARRFHESVPQSPTVVESAIELSEKYAALSERAATLRQEKESAVSRNKQLETQTAALDGQLRQTQKELAEANDLLIEMRIELNNWKADIIGFRDEMRDAETAQLQTLFRILQVLGGQVDAGPARSGGGGVGSAGSSSNRSYQ
jgi:septal ring factor EnvC (AmiA/AmiB activator)